MSSPLILVSLPAGFVNSETHGKRNQETTACNGHCHAQPLTLPQEMTLPLALTQPRTLPLPVTATANAADFRSYSQPLTLPQPLTLTLTATATDTHTHCHSH